MPPLGWRNLFPDKVRLASHVYPGSSLPSFLSWWNWACSSNSRWVVTTGAD
jgi:hypothetical protein